MSIHDGPGIRSVIFMKGCNLRCEWCHNPEAFSLLPELQMMQEKCITCFKCVDNCNNNALTVVNNSISLKACFNCVEHCYAEALQKVGKTISVDELISEVEQDVSFFNTSGGGVTFSGGEPMLQFKFLFLALTALKEKGFHVALETNMLSAWDKYEKILSKVDLILADLKLVSREAHKKVTGAHNDIILENLLKLDKSGVPFWIKTPVIPGVNDNLVEMEKIIGFVSNLKNLESFELLPYHSAGSFKYKNLDLENPFSEIKDLSTSDLIQYQPLLKKYKVKIRKLWN